MGALLEVPKVEDLTDLEVDVAQEETPGVVTVTAWADDGSSVALTWDEIAASVHLRWRRDGEDILVLTRETASKVTIRKEKGQIQLWVWSGVRGLGGELTIWVGASVTVTDSFLRT